MEDKYRVETDGFVYYTEDFVEAVDIATELSSGRTVYVCKNKTVLRIIRNGNQIFKKEGI